MSRGITATGVDGLPEVYPGDDLASMLVRHAGPLYDGDIVVVTSKVVSKSEARVVASGREEAVVDETARVVARREQTVIARTRHGITLAAAGVDASNTKPGTVVLLPLDPDASARRLRRAIRRDPGRNVAVVISDTAGRPWRLGQTDIAIGCAGLPAYVDHAGMTDRHGNTLDVTAPAVADEIAGLADLVMGKLDHCPAAVLRGLGEYVLAPEDDGPGADALIRDDAGDLFALGAQDAVVAAVRRDDDRALEALGARGRDVPEILELADAAGLAADLDGDTLVRIRGADDPRTAAALERVCAIAAASGWVVAEDGRDDGRCHVTLRRRTPRN
ncbi:MAG: coenzyme F420-0:L-glutamate ligase [Propionibacteriales bacterium]|nr:coenzyme F420-0:L-glutamate ligase [Propionibacteriales bacterium]